MTHDETLAEFRAAGALLEGHFILSSGRHSEVFFQKAFVFMDPQRTERLCRGLAAKATEAFGRIDVVVAPAVGAIIPGYEVSRALGARSLFVEREAGAFQLRRGFKLNEGERVLLVEDVVTTGLSSREALAALDGMPGTIVGAACLIDRSAGAADIGVPLISLAAVNVPSYDPNDLPAHLKDVPALKPGSRSLSS
jgi:orotate phosphoribosyltransferase